MSPVVIFEVGNTIVRLVEGRITTHRVDAIVDPANPTLLGGGVIDGAIHQAGGEAILRDCQKYRRKNGNVSPGEAIVTTAGELDADIVIHAVGPIWDGGDSGEPENLERCHTTSLMLAMQNDAETVAFPPISTGAYGYPIRRAAGIATGTVGEFLRARPDVFHEIRFVLPTKTKWDAYYAAAKTRYGRRIA